MTRTLAARFELARAHLRPSPRASLVLLAAGVPLVALLALGLGAVPMPPEELPAALVRGDHPFHHLLVGVRLPRVLAGLLVGGALAVSGVLLQALARNPLADPGLLGVSGGAAVAVVATLCLAPAASASLPAVALVGSLATVVPVLAGGFSGAWGAVPLRLLLLGVAAQSLTFALVALLTFLFADRAPAFLPFTLGSLAGVGWRELGFAAPGCLLGLAAACLMARPLSLLQLDDASAASVGLAVGRARLGAALVAALLASSAVAAAGLVGFVGLVVPNALRGSVGPGLPRLLPASALAGGLLLTASDAVARSVFRPLELPVGALLALLGAPFFVWLLMRRTA